MTAKTYMDSVVFKASGVLGKIVEKETVDWDLFERELAKITDINATCDQETILSELYHDCYDGHVLVEVTKRFLAHGYDVSANDGSNGLFCLQSLCWSTYDKYILDAAKLLLSAGAATKTPDGDDGEIGCVRDSISWRLDGDWVEGAYTVANIFEAYWRLVEAFEAGKDYRSIGTFEDCLGERLRRAEFVSAVPPIDRPPLTAFKGHMILWFGERPLVISKYIDLVVDPVFAEAHRAEAAEADRYLSQVLGAVLVRFVFIDQCTAGLQFDNGAWLLLSSTDHRDQDHRYGFFEIREDAEQADLCGKRIDSIVLAPGKTYAGTCDRFSEHSVALLCGEDAFLLHRYPEGYGKDHTIRIVKCSPRFVADYKRRLVLPELHHEKSFFHRQKLAGIRMRCGEKYFYLFSDGYDQLHMKLTEHKLSSWEELADDARSDKLVFRLDPPSGNVFQ